MVIAVECIKWHATIKSSCPKRRILLLHRNKRLRLQAFRAGGAVLRRSHTERCLWTEVGRVIDVKRCVTGKIKYLRGSGRAGIYIFVHESR